MILVGMLTWEDTNDLNDGKFFLTFAKNVV